MELLFHFKVVGFNADMFAIIMCTKCGMYSKEGSGSKLNSEALEIFWDIITTSSVCLHSHPYTVPFMWKLGSADGRCGCLWHSNRCNTASRSLNLPDDLLTTMDSSFHMIQDSFFGYKTWSKNVFINVENKTAEMEVKRLMMKNFAWIIVTVVFVKKNG